MEKYLVWYCLLLKQQCKKWTFWVLIALFVVTLGIVVTTVLPSADNCKVAIYDGGSSYGKTLLEELQEQDSTFQFVAMDSSEELEAAVRNHTVECGFVFDKDLEERMQDEDTDEVITYVASDFTTKGAIARETVFAVLFKDYSNILLLNRQKEIFGNDDSQIADELEDNYRSFLDSDTVFHVIVDSKNTSDAHSDSAFETVKDRTQIIRGLVSLLIFMTLLFARGEDIRNTGKNCYNTFSPALKRRFLLLRYAASVTIPAIIGLIILRLADTNLQWYLEFVIYFGFLVWACIWIYVFGTLFRSEQTYACWILTMLLMQLVLCPIFWNIGRAIPAGSYVSCMFPTGLYLQVIQWVI